MKQKSAKDIAFDRERERFRHEIRNLNIQLNENQNVINELNKTIEDQQQTILHQQELIENFLKFKGISKEELQTLIQIEKEKIKLREYLSHLKNFI